MVATTLAHRFLGAGEAVSGCSIRQTGSSINFCSHFAANFSPASRSACTSVFGAFGGAVVLRLAEQFLECRSAHCSTSSRRDFGDRDVAFLAADGLRQLRIATDQRRDDGVKRVLRSLMPSSFSQCSRSPAMN